MLVRHGRQTVVELIKLTRNKRLEACRRCIFMSVPLHTHTHLHTPACLRAHPHVRPPERTTRPLTEFVGRQRRRRVVLSLLRRKEVNRETRDKETVVS